MTEPGSVAAMVWRRMLLKRLACSMSYDADCSRLKDICQVGREQNFEDRVPSLYLSFLYLNE